MREPPTADSQHVFVPGLFAGQVALITGGGSGIGLATGLELARLGARVAICGRTADKLTAAAAELAAVAPGGAASVHAAVCDIREIDDVAKLVAGVVERFGGVDVLVNNAGGQFPAPAQHISANGFAAVVKNNLLGTWNVTREVANQAMIPQKRGRIVNIIANIYRGFPGMVHTGAARAGPPGSRELPLLARAEVDERVHVRVLAALGGEQALAGWLVQGQAAGDGSHAP